MILELFSLFVLKQKPIIHFKPQICPVPKVSQQEPIVSQTPNYDTTGDYADLFIKYFGDEYQTAERISNCESGFDQTAVSSNGMYWGLMQIDWQFWSNRLQVDPQSLLTAEGNISVAKQIRDLSGWSQWSCY
jgi:hypothetical protein